MSVSSIPRPSPDGTVGSVSAGWNRVITSRTPPTSVLTPGQPDARLSISATGVPSLRRVSRKTSDAA